MGIKIMDRSKSMRKSREVKRGLGIKTMGIEEQLLLNERKEKMKESLTDDTREINLNKLRAIGRREVQADQGTGLVDNNEFRRALENLDEAFTGLRQSQKKKENSDHDPELERQLDQLRRDAQTSEDNAIEPELADIKEDDEEPEVSDLETVDMLKNSGEMIKEMVKESKELEVEVVHTREQSKEKEKKLREKIGNQSKELQKKEKEIGTQKKRQEKDEAVKEGVCTNSLKALQIGEKNQEKAKRLLQTLNRSCEAEEILRKEKEKANRQIGEAERELAQYEELEKETKTRKGTLQKRVKEQTKNIRKIIKSRSTPDYTPDTSSKNLKLIETRQPKRQRMTEDMAKRLRKFAWPSRANFPTLDEFTKAIEMMARRLRDQNYIEEDIAETLYNHIMTTKLAARFMHSQRDRKATTISDIIEALKRTDAGYEDRTLEEKFGDIRRRQGEDFPPFMARIRAAYHEIEKTQAEPNDQIKLRKIKQQFFRGGDIPDDIKAPLRACDDLESIAMMTKEDMEKKSRGSPPKTGQGTLLQPTHHPLSHIPRSHRRGDTYPPSQPHIPLQDQQRGGQEPRRQETENREQHRNENQHTRGATGQETPPTESQ